MGTRNVTMVMKDKQYKVAKYCQWDGYLEAAGIGMLEFLRDKFKQRTFVVNLNKIKHLTNKELEDKWAEAGAQKGESWVTMDVSQNFKDIGYSHLSRDMSGYELLEKIQEGKIIDTQLDLEFVNDGLFCEFAYVVDLDKNTFEIYRGFCKSPPKKDERFAKKNDKGKKYYPVQLLKSYSLKKLPTNNQFLKLNKILEEEE